jgi:hypothetical protein
VVRHCHVCTVGMCVSNHRSAASPAMSEAMSPSNGAPLASPAAGTALSVAAGSTGGAGRAGKYSLRSGHGTARIATGAAPAAQSIQAEVPAPPVHQSAIHQQAAEAASPAQPAAGRHPGVRTSSAVTNRLASSSTRPTSTTAGRRTSGQGGQPAAPTQAVQHSKGPYTRQQRTSLVQKSKKGGPQLSVNGTAVEGVKGSPGRSRPAGSTLPSAASSVPAKPRAVKAAPASPPERSPSTTRTSLIQQQEMAHRATDGNHAITAAANQRQSSATIRGLPVGSPAPVQVLPVQVLTQPLTGFSSPSHSGSSDMSLLRDALFIDCHEGLIECCQQHGP